MCVCVCVCVCSLLGVISSYRICCQSLFLNSKKKLKKFVRVPLYYPSIDIAKMYVCKGIL